jgi:creatinine amidohydrolase
MSRNVFKNTMVEMNWPEIEQYANANATVLFPIGVIEEHGPHMCLGTDIYISIALAEMIRDVMNNKGFKAIIAPPFYWGIVGGVNNTFPGTFTARKDTVKALIFDIIQSLKASGFKNIIGLNSHGDWNHCQTIIEAFKEASERLNVNVYWQTFEDDLHGQGLSGNEQYVLAIPPYPDLFKVDKQGNVVLDIHAGAFETELMKEHFPDLVNLKLAETLDATNLQKDQIDKWANGGPEYKHLTPNGYCGNPAGYKYCHSDSHSFAAHIASGIIDFLSKSASVNDQR